MPGCAFQHFHLHPGVDLVMLERLLELTAGLEAGMGPQPTGRRRSLRFEFEPLGPDRNVQRIYGRYPGGTEQLFVEQVFTRRMP
jgi:hypothetical protein